MRARLLAFERWLAKAAAGESSLTFSQSVSHVQKVLFVVMALMTAWVAQPVMAGSTGAWTSGATPSSTANGVTITASSSAALTPSNATMNSTNYWSNPYVGGINGATSFNYVVNPGAGTQTVTFTFSKAVSSPVLHIQRLGGQFGTINSSSWQLTGSNLGSTPTMTRLSGNFQFQLNGAGNTFFRPTGGTFASPACTSAAASTSDDGGTACGSVRVNGTGITSLTFTVSMIGGAGSGDGMDLVWSIPNQFIAIKKQTIGGTGSFNFNGTNGTPTVTLSTATANPATSTASQIPNLTSAVTITEAATTGFSLTSANCVDSSSATVASSLSGSTLTIAANAYGDNGTVTCTFVNQARPILAVAKSAPSPSLAFGTNSTYTLTVTNSGPGSATTAQVKDQLPAGLNFVSATGTNWTCANASGLLTCNFAGGTIASNGGTSTIAIVVTPAATAGNTSVTNSASIDPTGGANAPAPGAGCSPAASCADNVAQVAAYINPGNDTGNGTSGTAGTAIANVVANDAINGTPATLGTSGNATVAQSGTWPAGISLNPTTGAISTNNAVPPGTYTVTYQLCDKGSPANCKTATATIVVAANIVPVTESGTGVSGTPSTVIANVAANDTVNGSAANIVGAGANATVSQSGTWPTGISLNTATGAVSISAAVLPGTYPITYQLCDKLSPANCATMADTVVVTANVAPAPDTGSVTAGSNSTAIPNIAANDTVNGSPANISGGGANATISQSGTWPNGINLNPNSGAVSVNPSVPPGTYTLPYQLCDRNTPVNCTTQTATVTVNAAIVPTADTGNSVSGVAATPVANVRSNDGVNGSPANANNSTIAQSGIWPAGIALNTTTGAITTSAGLQPGTYSVAYQLCDKNTPANCQTVTNTIVVAPAITPAADTGTSSSGVPSTPIANVVANDSVNGSPAILGPSGNATVATFGTWPAGITLNPATGGVSTNAAVPPGTYNLQYQVCDKNTPANCQTQNVTVTVNGNIAPVPETGTAVSGSPSTPIANVVANDNVNGNPATLGPSGNATITQSGTWPAGVTLNTTTGAISTSAAVQPGTYQVTYQLCDKASTPNCSTTTNTITVSANIAPAADAGSATAGLPSTPVTNVAANDTVNGTPATLGSGGNATVATVGTWPVGVSLNPATGAVTTAANAAPGTYNLSYQVCDKNTPVNCATQTVSVTIAPAIAPVAETGSAVSGTASTPIANVAANDSVNNAPATLGPSGNATVSQSGTWPNGISLNPTTGAITTSASVQPGSYPVAYQLCDKNIPANCQTIVNTINVSPSILPTQDSGVATAGTGSTPISNVAANDYVNGNPATLGPNGNATVASVGTWPSGVSLDPITGAVTTSAGTPPATYNLTYQLCDQNSPANCQTQTIQLVVNGAISPSPDTGNAVSGTPSTPISNIVANDTVNGPAATLGSTGNATVAPNGTWPAGFALNATTGAITIAASVQPGTYVLPYTLCDKVAVPNCANSTATVVVSANIVPVAETGNAVSGTPATVIANVRANDSVNGAPATNANSTITQSGTWPAGIVLNPTTGAITTNAAVQPGTYPITYQLCDLNAPANCQTITDTITIAANISPVSETRTATSGTASTPIANVAANDDVNGAPATLGPGGNATVAQSGTWPSGISLDPSSGAINVASNVRPGTYPVAYQLCDKNTPANCQTIANTIAVNAAILPTLDTGAAAAGSVQTPIANVAANDSVNGSPALLGGASPNATVAPIGIWPAGVTLNPTTGAITTTASVPPGNYTLQYQLCDTNTPVNCATSTASFTLSASIVPQPDSGSGVSGTPSTVITNIVSNDAVNGSAATLAGASFNATVAQVGTWPTGITLNPLNGNISIDAAVQPGVYTVTYQLCDRNTPVNCATTTDTITVTAAIRPITDSGSAVSGTPSTPIANVAANDTVNGFAATLGATGNATVATSGTWPNGIALDPVTGAVTTDASVQPGSYTVQYQLCDKNTPANCQTQNVTIVVAADVAPTPDAGSAFAGTQSTPIPSVILNDNVNGFGATLGAGGNASVAQVGNWPNGISLDASNGAITADAGVQPGTYAVQYQLCDKNTPANCVTTTATVTIVGAIYPSNDNGTAVSGTPSTPIANIAVNDVVNGTPAALGPAGNATIATTGTWPAGITLDPATGAVATNANVQPGTYVLQYQLCDKSAPPFCALANVTIVVSANIAPNADAGSSISGTASTPIANVIANDNVNGAPVALGAGGNATIVQTASNNPGVALNPATGAVTVAANVQPGTYVVNYRLCDRNAPVNCANSTATVTVSASILPTTEAGNAVSGTPSTPIANVALNDMVNGVAATLGTTGNAIVSEFGTWPAGIALAPSTGAITVSASVQPGTYNVTYQLCDKNTPQNCQTMSDTIVVASDIRPRVDTGSANAGTTAIAIANIAANDTVNGVQATVGPTGNATVADNGSWPTGISLDPATGAITSASSVVPGTYTLPYVLCDKSTPANCMNQDAIITVFADIKPTPDQVTVSAAGGNAVPNVTANDVVNGQPATLGSGGNATIAQSGTWPAGMTLDTAQGAVTVAPGTAPGVYRLTYELCDRNTPVNCQTTLVKITVTPEIVPVTETGNAISGTPNVAIANIATNDMVNGIAATLGVTGNATIAAVGTWPTGISLDPATGAVSTNATVQPGTYALTYQLCDKNSPVNCADMTDTITVTANIRPNADNGTMVAGTPSTPIANVAVNDLVNGAAATLGTSGNASVATSGTWPSGITLNPNTGAIAVGARVQPGTYNVDYQLCDKNAPVNCQIATATIVVSANILPIADNGTAVSGTSSTPIADIAANDTVNGTPALVAGSSGTARVATIGTWPTGFSLTPTTGAVSITNAVAPGNYVLPYELCDRNAPANCQNSTATVVVLPSIQPTPKTGSAISGTPATPIANIAANTRVNGSPAEITGASPNATVATSGTWPTGITLDIATGAVSTDATVQPGVYVVQYQLCDKNSPVNCQTETATITVVANIKPLADAGSATSGTPATAVTNIAVNDMVNGQPATLGTSGNATVAQTGTWPTGISLDAATGSVSTTAAVQPGVYTATYQLCDKNSPVNCQTETVTVTVAGNILPLADAGTATSGTAATPVASVSFNDMVNGQPATLGTTGNATVAPVGTWPSGIGLDPTTGGVSTNAAVQPGVYTMSYQLCDKNSPANCQTQTVTITVAANIVPISDSGSAISGTPATPVANIAANDMVNGQPATLGTSGNSTVAVVGTWPIGITLDPATGAVATNATVQPGVYTMNYQLCDKSSPVNCQSQAVTVTVAGNIVPVADTGSAISGASSTPLANVAANDMVNGQTATLGLSGNATIAPVGTWPASISLNPTTGAVTTNASVQPGVYAMSYQICDKSTPANCQTQSVTVTVTGNITPVADTGSAISGIPTTPVTNVAANDAVNGQPATLGTSGNAIVAPVGTWPTGITLDPATGAVATNASVQPGVYTMNYQLCDKSTPANCETQTVTVTVAGNIVPIADAGSATSGIPSTPVANVTANDMVNGQPATLGVSGNATIAQVGSWPTGISLDPTTGAVSTTAAVQPSVYTVSYQLCDKSTPANCQTQTVTVTVTGNIVPVADAGSAISGASSTPVANVAANDMVNGQPATLGASGNATVAPIGTWPIGISLDAITGAVSTGASVQPGVYPMSYQLCDKSTPANCQTQTVTITVAGNIAPVADNGSAVAGTPSTPVANIAANDLVNGQPATLGNAGNATMAPVGTWPTGINLDPATGGVSTSAAVQPGAYTMSYQLCDKSTPANCQTQTVTINVSGNIVPAADSGSAVSGIPSTPISNVAANDVVNGQPATLGTSGNATVAPVGTWPTGISLDPNTGAVSTSALVQPGVYTMSYQLCDKSTPANCQTQTISVNVDGNIAPIADSGSATSGTPATPVVNVAANDSVNGQPVTLGASGNATLTLIGSWPLGISLDPTTGAVSTSAAVQPGIYTMSYQLCDKSSPINCQTQTVTVNVAGNISPVADSGSAISGTPATPVANVAANDMINGQPATLGASGNATIAPIGTWPTGINLDPTTGAVSTSAAVQPGVYALSYQLCDKNTPVNCQTQIVTITVAGNIVPVADAGSATSGTQSIPVVNVAANDTVNGQRATLGASGNATVAPVGTWPTGITLNPATGAVSTNAAVQPGAYIMSYQLCDKSTPANCQMQTVTITVAGNMAPLADSGSAIAGTPSTPVTNIAANDMVNGQVATLGASGNATVARVGAWPTGITLDPATGMVSTSAAVQPGAYTMSYQLCDKNTPANCQTQTVTITIAGNIAPIADNGSATAGIPATPVANIAANDIVNGQPATLGANGNATVATAGAWPTGISLDPSTGAVSTHASVQPGVYTLSYQLCDKSSPVNCQTQTVTITVTANIVPLADSGSATSGAAATPVANIVANDMVNGQQATLGSNGNASIAQNGAWPVGITLDPSTGAVSISATVQAGVYPLTYQLCDQNSPANCQTQTVTITVIESRGSIVGTVYTDANADAQRQTNEQTRPNWIVELISNGNVVATTRTDTNGNYRFDNLPQGPGYEVRFINPDNNVVFGQIPSITVTARQTVVDQNLPIDPAGVIFNSVTRAPIGGAIVTIVDSNGVTLPASCFLDPSQRSQRTGSNGEYHFDLVPGAAPQCPSGETVYRIVVTPPAGFSANSTVLLPLAGPFDPTGLTRPVRISPLPTPAASGDVPYYMTFRLAAGDPDIVFNHIPLDPFLTRAPLVVIKTTPLRNASTGDLVPYEITVRNTEGVRRAGVSIVDILPPGMKLVPGSATVDGVANTPVTTDRDLTWLNQTINANGSITYRVVLVVGAGVTAGEKVNTALARSTLDGATISNRATAAITIAPSSVFDCSDLIGKVFEDRNRNGYQDEGEPGVPGARLVTVNGQLITTDEFGRYHITCAAVPDARIGSNFVLKVDTRSLPLNWDVTTDNPRSIRLTRGKFGELNFGVAPKEDGPAPSSTEKARGE